MEEQTEQQTIEQKEQPELKELEGKKERYKTNVPILIFLVLILALIFGYFWYYWQQLNALPQQLVLPPIPQREVIEKEDSVSAVNKELQEIEVLDLDQEFQEIDQDVNSL